MCVRCEGQLSGMHVSVMFGSSWLMEMPLLQFDILGISGSSWQYVTIAPCVHINTAEPQVSWRWRQLVWPHCKSDRDIIQIMPDTIGSMKICRPRVVKCCWRVKGPRATFDNFGSTNSHYARGTRLNLFCYITIWNAINLLWACERHFVHQKQSRILCDKVVKCNSSERVQYFHHRNLNLERVHIHIHILQWPRVCQKLKRSIRRTYMEWKALKFVFNYCV